MQKKREFDSQYLQRKKRKANEITQTQDMEANKSEEETNTGVVKAPEVGPKKQRKNFKDEEYFMSYMKPNHYAEKALSLKENINSNDISMDLVGDDSSTINQHQNVTKWDRKKKKFVKVGNNEKKIKTESGEIISASKAEKGKL